MLRLFDPPKVKIRKHLPVNAYKDFEAVAVIVFSLLAAHGFEKQKKEVAGGAILSVWACNSCMAGAFQLQDYDYRYIVNMGMNCSKILGNRMAEVSAIIDDLIAKGVITSKS